MDMGSKDDAESEKKCEDALSFESPNMSSDWQSGSNLTNASLGMFSNSNPIVDSFCASVWDHPISSSNLRLCDTNTQMIHCNTNADRLRTNVNRMLGTSWTQPNAMSLKGGMFVPPTPGMLPQSLSQFPADSGFIERAARFSCFSGGKVGDMKNPFTIPSSPNTYRNALALHRPQEVFASNRLQSPSTATSQKQRIGNMVEDSEDVSLPLEHGATDKSPIKHEKNESFARSLDEAKECIGISANESDEAEFSGHQDQVEGKDSSARGLGSKKRKRSSQGFRAPDCELERSIWSLQEFGGEDSD